MQPGETIQPGGATSPEEPKQPETTQDTPVPVVVASVEAGTEEPDSQWQFTGDDQPGGSQPPATLPATHETVTWTASEYVSHEKNAGWYVALTGAVVICAAVVFLLTDELLSPVVILIMGVAFGSFAARKPEELTYVLESSALRIGQKAYPYAQFKSFTILEEGPMHSIILMPMQRFMPPLSIYFDPVDEDKIADALQSYLPYEDRKQDYIDKLMRKVRF